MIRGGTVFDGSGSYPVRAHVLVQGDRIATVGDNLAAEATTVVDAGDCWVLPGFIDVHAHTDVAVLTGRGMTVRHAAGITTEVVGQDGLGFAPLIGRTRQILPSLVEPIAGPAPSLDWHSLEDYLAQCSRKGISRVAALLPHGTIRMAVMGLDQRAATAAEVREMQALAQRSLDEGACGLSTGMSYPPAKAASLDELIAIYRPFALRGRPYVTHLRDYGPGLDDALEEAIEIVTRTEGHLHLSHFHVSGAGRDGETRSYLDRLAELREEGLRITLDSYPYTTACTFLTSFLPAWVLEEKPDRLNRVLVNQAARIAHQLDAEGPGATVAVGWEGFRVTGLVDGSWRDENGERLVDAATRRGLSTGEAIVELCIAYPRGIAVLVEQGHLENILAIASDLGHMVGSDGIMGSGMPHPRVAGSFIRFLRWARDGLLDLTVPEMVRRMTAAPADLLGCSNLGRIRQGGAADIAVVDPSMLEDGPDSGTWQPTAVRHLMIGGKLVRRNGAATGERASAILKCS